MTKIKNTKKGMAKKTLSMSLVVAMLATSNVPVWAAEFSDGTDAAVATEAETPVITDNSADVFSDTAEAPVVEDNTAVAASDQYTNNTTEVNSEGYTVSNLKLTVNGWGSEASLSGSVKDANGNDVKDLQYTWLANGYQAAGVDASGKSTAVGTATNATVDTIKYTPAKEDFNKTLSLVVYKEDENGTKTFCTTLEGGVVQPKKITCSVTPSFDKVTYNGKEQKVTPKNEAAFVNEINNEIGANKVTKEDITWNYTTKGDDFTNVTDENINVVGSLAGTYVKGSAAYGYSYTTSTKKPGTYKISKLRIDARNIKMDLKKTSVSYTGKTHTFKLADVNLYVSLDDNNKIDITNAFKADTTFTGTATAVSKNNKVTFVMNSLDNQLNTEDDAAKKILDNFDAGKWGTATVTSENGYDITMLDLSKCTGEVTKEYKTNTFKANKYTVAASDIKLTTPDGESFTLENLVTSGDINIAVNQVAKNAADNNTTGTIADAVTVSFKTDTKNVTGSLNLPIVLTKQSLADATVTVKVNNASTATTLNTSTKTAPAFEVTYNGTAYDLEKSDIFKDFKISDDSHVLNGEYELSYSDNVNAGVVTVTITGKEAYAGSTKKVYFKIAKANVATTGLETKDSVTVNPNNNSDASLYKEALDAKVKTTLNTGSKVTLEEGKDYTTKYYYASVAGLTTETQIKNNAGTNNAGQYLYVVATPVKDGNYTFAGADGKLVKGVKIAKKSISGATITLEKDTYTFTGAEIIPNLTVKDGSYTLEKGVDYTVKVKDNKNVGTATVTITPTNVSDYDTTTTITATFKIEAAKAEDVKITLSGNDNKAVASKKADGTTIANTFDYNKGKQIQPKVTAVTLNGNDVTEYFDITYPTYGENNTAGTGAGSVTISPKTTTKNFTGTKTHLFNIKGDELTGKLKVYYNDKTLVNVVDGLAKNKNGDAYSYYYDGSEQKFASETFTANGNVDVKEGTDYEFKYINNVNAGYAFVAVVAKGNYQGTTTYTNAQWKVPNYKVENGQLKKVEGNKTSVIESNIIDVIAFYINPTVVTAKNITVSNGVYAGGLAVKPQVNVTVGGKTLTEGTDYELVLSSIDGKSTPDKFTNVTANKPYYVKVNLKGGYNFDNVNGTNQYVWGIDKKDLKDCSVNVDKNLNATVMNGNVLEKKENFDVKDNGDGTATVSVVDGGVNYTGSVTVDLGTTKIGAPMISSVKVVGNKATAILSGDVEGASGYDYVISTDRDCITNKDYASVNKNQVQTSTTFKYVQQGTYYAYCHAWTRDENGKKVFGEWSNAYPFSVTAITPDAPVITNVKVSGSTIKVTYKAAANATGYDVVLGTSSKKENGETRPYNYGAHKVLNLKEGTVTATFKNVPKGTWTVGMHAFNRTSEDGKKVFSPWSNLKKATVK
ncbi:hypothetical protein [Blautia sp. MSJ-9]|uniref:hypothetical protein n=1 Tax=Blautia sp. MSJ-9 TaxID=2841511 RepID=UPI001C12499A|nr:hypothetical protein [Blautia sp. MSJ-9]MBU5681819.1 hypothetical protein [Blautia sp. MSJ-9]